MREAEPSAAPTQMRPPDSWIFIQLRGWSATWGGVEGAGHLDGEDGQPLVVEEVPHLHEAVGPGGEEEGDLGGAPAAVGEPRLAGLHPHDGARPQVLAPDLARVVPHLVAPYTMHHAACTNHHAPCTNHHAQCFQAQIGSILVFIFSLFLLSDLVFIDYM